MTTTISGTGTVPSRYPSNSLGPMPFGRYRAFPPIDLPDRTWPANRTTRALRWLSTDLRDGNQALIDPMTPLASTRCSTCWWRWPQGDRGRLPASASQTDFDFVRQLIERERIPSTTSPSPC